jgi:hypothetical protein
MVPEFDGGDLSTSAGSGEEIAQLWRLIEGEEWTRSLRGERGVSLLWRGWRGDGSFYRFRVGREVGGTGDSRAAAPAKEWGRRGGREVGGVLVVLES